MRYQHFLLYFLLIIQPFSSSIFAQSSCLQASSQEELDINNVRAVVGNGGDLWYDRCHSTAGYEVAQGANTYTTYAGSMILGGRDVNNSLKLAGFTYRGASEFWPGPLSNTTALVDDTTCNLYDRHWKINRWQVEEFVQRFGDTTYTIPEVILNWPAHGDISKNQDFYLAPFHDANNDGVYNPYDGDYPEFDLNNQLGCNDKLLGDQCIWWITNDRGNLHLTTGTDPIGVEVQHMAYAYLSNDALNNTTYYHFKLINRSTNTLLDTYFGNFIDSDVGNAFDDFLGCDVTRGMGYTYNGDAYDEDNLGATGYLDHPAAVGYDYVQGPLANANDGVDNDHDGIIDEADEQVHLSKYMTFNNGGGGNPAQSAPYTGLDYYNYLSGHWKDNTDWVFGGSGHVSDPNANPNIAACYFRPGYSDTTHFWGTGGTDPGYIWTEENDGNIPGDRRAIQSVGPFTFAPGDVEDITLAVTYGRDMNGDNYDAVEQLRLADDIAQQAFDNCFTNIGCVTPINDYYILYGSDNNPLQFNFGYMIDATSFAWDFGDGTTSTDRFVGHTYTTYGVYDVCLTVTSPCGNLTICETIDIPPHPFLPSPAITRIEGDGNGGLSVELADSTVTAILNSPTSIVDYPTYQPNHGPVKVSIYDNDSLVTGTYTIQFDGVDSTAHWKLFLQGGTDTVYADTTIAYLNHQYIPQWGLVVSIQQHWYDQMASTYITTPIESSIDFTNNAQPWLTGIGDRDMYGDEDWIRAGVADIDCDPFSYPPPMVDPCEHNDYIGQDHNQLYETLAGGTWAPYRLMGYKPHDPLSITYSSTVGMNPLSNLQSVDVVFTNDQNLWTRCAVLEMQENSSLSEGNVNKMELRSAASVDKNGTPDGTGNGMGWFPGYAINVETGERLNMAFGEDSWLASENGRDMQWNPTANKFTGLGEPLFGGKHYVFVFNEQRTDFGANRMPRYDEGNYLDSMMHLGYSSKIQVWRSAMWVGSPMLEAGETLLSNDAKVRLRVKRPYETFATTTPVNNENPLYNFSIDTTLFVGVGALEQQIATTLYPNPFKEYTTLYFTNDNNDPHQLVVYDIEGREVRKYAGIRSNQITIYKEQLERGMYFYRLVNEAQPAHASGKLIVY